MPQWITSGYYPFAEVYDTDYKPVGAEVISRQIIDQAWPQFAAILESGARIVGLRAEQISPFRNYERPGAPGYYERLYASQVMKKFGVTLSGDEPDFKQLLEEGAKQAVKESIVEGIAMSLPGGGAAQGAIKVAVQLVENPKFLKTKQGRMNAGFTIASTIPVVNIGANMAQVAMALSKDQAGMFKTTQGKVQAGLMIAATVPGLQAGAAVGLVAMQVKGMIDAKKAIAEAKKEANRGEHYIESVHSYINAAIPEAQALALTCAERGFPVLSQATSDFTNSLKAHYHELVYSRIRDRNAVIEREKAEFMLKGGLKRIVVGGASGGLSPFSQGGGSDWTMRFKPNPLKFGRKDDLRVFLQFARDMRKVRLAIEGGVSARGSVAKTAATVAQEIRNLTAEILLKDPSIPYQSAVNMAAGISRKAREPLPPGTEKKIGAAVAKKVGQVKVNDNKVSMGLMIGMSLLRFLK